MKKKLFNNKGSTMVMLVIAVAVISLLGTSILAVTLMNYRIKLANTEMKTAFYLSESGLDRAYENAYKLIVTAVTDANDAANEFVDSFDDDKMLDLIEARDFNYLEPKTFSEDTVYKYDESAIQEAAKDIFEKEYVDVILAKGSYIGDDDIADVLRNASDDDLIVEVTNEPLSFSGKEMTVGIESEYTSDKGTKRITAVNLIVEIPKYNESYAIETKIVDVNPFWLKALAARRLDIENSSTFRGDVFVEENLNVNSSGINPKFNNVLAVRGYTGASDVPDEDKGIRLNDSSTANVSNVFAKNILLTAPGARFRADSSGSKYMFVTIWKLTEVIKQYISTALISVFLTAAKVLLPILQAALILMRLPDSALQLQAVYTFTAHLMLMFIMLQVKNIRPENHYRLREITGHICSLS